MLTLYLVPLHQPKFQPTQDMIDQWRDMSIQSGCLHAFCVPEARGDFSSWSLPTTS